MSRLPIFGGTVGLLWGLWTLVVLPPVAAQFPPASPPPLATPTPEPAVIDSARSPSADLSAPSHASRSDSTLHLSDLLRAAAAANPSLQAARLRAEARATDRAQARALPDPVVGATYFPYSVVTARGAQRTQWRMQQSIPFPGTRALKGDIADLGADAAGAQAEALAQELALRIQRAYYTLYRVRQHQRLIRRFQADLEQFEEAALAQYEVGTEGQPAVLKAQIERQRLGVRLETLAADRRSSLQTLARLTGRPSLADTAAVPAVTDPRPAPEPSADDAIAQRPEAQALQSQIDRSERETALARKDRWPDLTLGMQYFDIRQTGLPPTMTGRDALAVSVGVQVPLWRGKQRAQIEEARLEQRQAEAELEAFRLEVRTQIADLRSRRERQRRQLTLLDETLLPKAETAREATLSGYRTGQNDFLDLLDAERTLFQLRLDRASVYARLLKTTAELERAIGQTRLPRP